MALREACVILESQLKEFEDLYSISESKRQDLVSEIEDLSTELSKTKNDLIEAKKSINEEKSFRFLSETKCKRLHEDMTNLEEECNSFKEQSNHFEQQYNILSDDITRSEQKITDLEVKITWYERQMENCVIENKIFKEERSNHLTYLDNLKEANYKLNQNLSDYKVIKRFLLYFKSTYLQCLVRKKTKFSWDKLMNHMQHCQNKQITTRNVN